MGRASPVAIGVDYGTESGRVVLLDLVGGKELSGVAVRYAHGVIDSVLPGSAEPLGHEWALQHPCDYLEVLYRGVPAALEAAAVDPARVIGLGVDFTSCTVLPARSDGTPLSQTAEWSSHPHAWPKLWKHHAAQRQADRLSEVAHERGEHFIARYGGRVSSEWYFPKLIEIFEQDRQVYDATYAFVEATDWIVWQLTGTLARSSCAAGYKAFWSEREGLPPDSYFSAAFPGFSEPAAKLGNKFWPLGSRAGYLLPEMAARLGLGDDVAVAVGNVDSFVSVPGCGVDREGVFVMVVGTSICDMVVHRTEVLLPGITGVVAEGILPGFYGYEAGQPAVGDMFAWYADHFFDRSDGAATRAERLMSLERAASAMAPGASGLLALDWWNGNRSVLADADLSGVIVGLTLNTTREQVYRALLESVALGTKRIVSNFEEHGVGLSSILACGGIAQKSSLLMQMVSDVTGLVVEVPASEQVPARGAAVYGAVAAGPAAGGFSDLAAALERLSPPLAQRYRPDPAASEIYARLYDVYRPLHDLLGKDHAEWLHTLNAIRRASPIG